MSKFWYIYVIVIKLNKKRIRLFQPVARLLYIIQFSDTLSIKTSPFIRDLRVGIAFVDDHLNWLNWYHFLIPWQMHSLFQ